VPAAAGATGSGSSSAGVSGDAAMVMNGGYGAPVVEETEQPATTTAQLLVDGFAVLAIAVLTGRGAWAGGGKGGGNRVRVHACALSNVTQCGRLARMSSMRQCSKPRGQGRCSQHQATPRSARVPTCTPPCKPSECCPPESHTHLHKLH
jgi:hypothetical protein